MAKYAFGVDLGGTTIKLGFFDSNGTLIEKWEIKTRKENGAAAITPDIADSIQNKISEKNLTKDEIIGIGIGVPGAVLEGRYVSPCVNLNGWGGDIGGQLEELTGLTVNATNDANAAALGEMTAGGGKGFKNLLFVTLGTGIGGGVIIDGQLIPGVHGAGGEIGHIKVANPDDDICGCGNSGCLERYSSATGVVLRAKKLLKDSSISSKMRDFDPLTCKDVIDCAKEGDEAALQIIEQMTKMLGKAIAAASCVFDPDIVVIGGGVSRAGDFLTERIQKYFRQFAFPPAYDTKFALAELGNDAGIFGSVRLVL